MNILRCRHFAEVRYVSTALEFCGMKESKQKMYRIRYS